MRTAFQTGKLYSAALRMPTFGAIFVFMWSYYCFVWHRLNGWIVLCIYTWGFVNSLIRPLFFVVLSLRFQSISHTLQLLTYFLVCHFSVLYRGSKKILWCIISYVNLGPRIKRDHYILCSYILFLFWTFQFIMVNKQAICTCFVKIALLSHYRDCTWRQNPPDLKGPFFICGGGDNWRHLYRLHCEDIMFSALLVFWGSADTYEYSLINNYYSSFLMNISG